MPEECIFCKIVKGEIPAFKVYEDSKTLAFLDINPRNPGHTLIIPKSHHETILTVSEDEGTVLFSAVKKVSIALKNGLKADGLSILQNNGEAAGQVVSHLHFHVIPRFNSERPVALEALLPVKKPASQEAMQQLVSSIKAGFGGPVEQKKEEPKQEKKIDKKKDMFDFR